MLRHKKTNRFRLLVGATISAPGAPISIHLLPGQYTSSTNPQLLHNLLTASSASLSSSPGFESSSSSISLPLNLALEPGLAIYSDIHFSGQAAFSQLPSSSVANSSVPLAAKSFAISTNVWASIRFSSEERIVFWDTVPDVTQLPTDAIGSLALLDLQSSACSPPCAGAGVCSASGTCACPSGFTGSACESCAPGFFGPTCQACPTGCTSCDEGVSGTGRCLTPLLPSNAPSTCNCLNGICGSDGQCACNAGWTNADNGTACAKCSTGFFLTSTSDCKGGHYTLFIVYVVTKACLLSLPSRLHSMCRRYGFMFNLQDWLYERRQRSNEVQPSANAYSFWRRVPRG